MRRIVLFGVMLAIGIGCSALGIWQLHRLASRRAANAAFTASNRRVEINGTLDEGHEFILRNHLVQGVPAVMVVTPFRRPGNDTAVLVNRGYVPAPDAATPGATTWSEADRTHFQGTLLPIPDRGDGDPVRYRGRETWRALDLKAMRARLPYPVADVYLVAQVEAAEGDAHTVRGTRYPFRADLPPMDDGPHLMYAIQWFGIAAAVVGFGWLFVIRGTRAQVLEP